MRLVKLSLSVLSMSPELPTENVLPKLRSSLASKSFLVINIVAKRAQRYG